MKRIACKRLVLTLLFTTGIVAAAGLRPAAAGAQADVQLPSSPLKFGVFVARFDPAGTFKLEGDRWPTLVGNWKIKGDEIELATSGGPKGCEAPGRYRVRSDGSRVSFAVISDDCVPRRMILDRSTWSPAEEVKKITPRRIVRTAGNRAPARPEPGAQKGNWPSFRGPLASGVTCNSDHVAFSFQAFSFQLRADS